MKQRRAMSFAVPAGSGQYAPEVLYLRQTNESGMFDFLQRVALFVSALPATAVVEVDLLSAAAANVALVPPAGDWLSPVALSLNATGFNATLAPGGWYGARVRAKSGGTAGTATVHATWTDEV